MAGYGDDTVLAGGPAVVVIICHKGGQ